MTAADRAADTAGRTTRPDSTAEIDSAAEIDGTPARSRNTTPAADGWTVLVAGGSARSGADRPMSLRRVLITLALSVVVVTVVVAVVGGLLSRRTAEQQAVHDAAQTTDLLASSVIQPALTDRMLTDLALAKRVFDPIARERVSQGSVSRVKIWTATGRVLYSDEPRIIGRTFPLDDEAQHSFSGPSTVASVTDLSRPENVYERSQGKLLEVYRPVWTPKGEPLLFEAYYPYQVVNDRADSLWRGFAGILLSSLAAVFALLLPLVWALVGRIRRAQRQREQLMQRALDASHDERRRIAATLHDGAVQDLAAASFAVSGAAERAAARGDREQAEQLHDTAATVRATLGGMRSLLVDIYPPSLRSAGLAAALRDLGSGARAGEARVELTIDAAVADALTPEQQEAVFRVAQEALRNAAAHARATRVGLSLTRVDGAARLEIVDDGAGFTVDDGSPQGHFGLTLMSDVAREAGATLAIRSGPGAGTAVRWDVPLP